MNKKYKIGLIILILISIVILIFGIVNVLNNTSKSKENIEQLDFIKEYGYSLDKRDTKIMKDKFKELKEVLKNDNVNYEEYAKLLSSLYVIDLFTLTNKVNKYDIPSLEYIIEENRENFSNNISDTIYKYIIDNSDKKRKQELPEVIDVNVKELEEIKYKYNDKEYDGYKVDIEWSYKEDLGYDKKAMIRLIRSDNKLYIVGYEPSEASNEENN